MADRLARPSALARLGAAGAPFDSGPTDDLVIGPSTWWAGALDVEGLLRSSLALVCHAGAELSRRRAAAVQVSSTAERLAGTAASFRHLRVGARPTEGFAPLSGYFETADGWVRLHGNYPHHAAVLHRVLGARERDTLVAALRRRTAEQVEHDVVRAGGVAGALRDPARWRASEMATAVDADPWVAIDRRGGPQSARPLTATADAPMTGMRVLDLTRVVAGPHGSRLLALLGADVLRVDPPAPAELLDQYLDSGAGKRSAVADLGDPGTAAATHRLLDDADVVLTGYRPGALARFGLDDATIAERHPHLVHVSLSAWGTAGPWRDRRGFDSIVQSCTGIGVRYAAAGPSGDTRPGVLPVQALDMATGFGVAAVALGLLADRAEHGGGHARLSLARTAHALLDAPPPAGPPVDLPPVPLASTDSPHGRLDHVAGPLLLDGRPVPLAAPGRYGASPLEWRPERVDRGRP